MTTQESKDGANHAGDTQSAIHSRSRSCGGSHIGSQPLMMLELYTEADPVQLCRAICLVYDRWISQGKKPGSDNLVNSTRSHRPALVAEIIAEWERISDVDHDDDLFPYHESYVIRKWVQFRKQNDSVKVAMIAASKFCA